MSTRDLGHDRHRDASSRATAATRSTRTTRATGAHGDHERPSPRAKRTAARMVAQGRIATPMGEMTVAVTGRGVAGLWFDHQSHHPGAFDIGRDDTNPHVVATRAWLDAYWRGETPGTIALDPAGTPFQQAVWRALRAIPLGRTCTYGDIAAAIGRPAASRAVGAAIGRNPVGIVVPCHRVIGRDGTLTGYAGGLDRKQRLLAHEKATPPIGSTHPLPLDGGVGASWRTART
jgi:methylated-DNA-[protein]-cysteine S-methyltransferase